MWSDRTKDSFAGRSSAPSNNPAPVTETAGGVGNMAVIGRGMVIKGDITSKESLRIDGEVDGSLDLFDCQLTVGREGRVGANASAREIELLGTVRGNLEATSKITIRKGARLIGDLRAPGILGRQRVRRHRVGRQRRAAERRGLDRTVPQRDARVGGRHDFDSIHRQTLGAGDNREHFFLRQQKFRKHLFR